MKKIFIYCGLILAFIVFGNNSIAQPPWYIGHNPEQGGDYLPNVTANLVGNTLTISGSGNMADFWCTGTNQYDDGGEAPWYIAHRDEIYTVVFQNGSDIKNIGMRAFKECVNLQTIEIPSSVTKINAQAFYGCSSLAIITIPGSVNTVGGEAFYSCNALNTVTIKEGGGLHFKGYKNSDKCNNNPNSTDRHDWFKNCNIQTLYLGRNITYDRVAYAGYDSPFKIMSLLKSLTIGDKVTLIDQGVFYDCPSLNELIIEDSDDYLKFYGASLSPYNYHPFKNSPIKTMQIGRNIIFTTSQELYYNTFQNNTNLSQIFIGCHVTSIPNNTFSGCTNLTKITSYPKPPIIGSNTFNNIQNITVCIHNAYLTAYKNAPYWSDVVNYEFTDDLCDFVPVSNIILDPPATATVNEEKELKGKVFPENATYKDISWKMSINDSGETNAEINGNIFIAKVPGKATITAIVTGGGRGDYEQDFDIKVNDVGITNITLLQLKVYPNPTCELLVIENGKLTIENVDIFDIYGKKQSSESGKLKAGEFVLNISHLSTGVYFVKIRTEKGEVVRKVVKE